MHTLFSQGMDVIAVQYPGYGNAKGELSHQSNLETTHSFSQYAQNITKKDTADLFLYPTK